MLTVIFSVPFPVLVAICFFVFVFVFDILNALCDPAPSSLGWMSGSMYVVVEGMENVEDKEGDGEGNGEGEAKYVPYDLKGTDKALMLAQQNAGNINYLKQRVEESSALREKVDEMKSSMDAMQIQINGLVQQQAEYAQELAGSAPPTITGTNLVDEDSDATS